jgi:cob(I)alamin adenosyltransferase
MSIATQRGDAGQTSLAGGVRVSKGDIRVEAYGTVDELIAVLGFARAICRDRQIAGMTKDIQRQLFQVGSAIATLPDGRKTPPEIPDDLVDRLTAEVHRIETMERLVSDWSVTGEDAVAAAFDMARTVCRRAERLAVRLKDCGVSIQPNVLRYLNRLSDLLWLLGRQIEVEQGIDARLRDSSNAGPRWSRAW